MGDEATGRMGTDRRSPSSIIRPLEKETRVAVAPCIIARKHDCPTCLFTPRLANLSHCWHNSIRQFFHRQGPMQSSSPTHWCLAAHVLSHWFFFWDLLSTNNLRGLFVNGLASWALTAAWLKVGVQLHPGLAAPPGLTGLKCVKDKKRRRIDRNSVAHAITASLAQNSQGKAMMLQLTLVLRQQMPCP